MFVKTDETGRIQSTAAEERFLADGAIAFTFPQDFDFGLQAEYRIVKKALVHDPLPPPETPPSPQEEIAILTELQALREENMLTMLAVTEIFELMIGAGTL